MIENVRFVGSYSNQNIRTAGTVRKNVGKKGENGLLINMKKKEDRNKNGRNIWQIICTKTEENIKTVQNTI